MPYLIGMDEAGYGPNLGPLVISASAWYVPEGVAAGELYELLADCVAGPPFPAKRNADPVRLAIGDSKDLYRPGGGVALLEQAVQVALHLLKRRVRSWDELWEALSADGSGARREQPWHDGFSLDLPLEVSLTDVKRCLGNFRQSAQRTGIRLVDLRSVAIFPRQFNELVQRYGGKGAALSRLTLGLLSEVLEPLDEPARVICDKHGGRNCYASLLQEHFSEYLIEIYGEDRAESVYRWGPSSARTEVRFLKNGERFLPAALAAMTSKYLREIAMLAFNEFWLSKVPGLRPTAGYAVDSRRFKTEIAATQQSLGIADELLWRER